MAEHYDELDELYRELWGEHLHHGYWDTGEEDVSEAVRALTRRVAREARVEEGNRICDVGCGYGAPARLLAEKYGARVTGYTLSRRQVEIARRRNNPGQNRYLLRNWTQNRCPSARFDVVIALESLSHMEDKPLAIEQAYRVLRPGGRFVACVWGCVTPVSPWQRQWLLQPICREGQLGGLASVEEYRRWCVEAGFTGIDTREWTRRVRRTWTICLRRLGFRFLRDPGIWSYLLDPSHAHRMFARAMLRLWLAYRVGAMGYWMLSARKP